MAFKLTRSAPFPSIASRVDHQIHNDLFDVHFADRYRRQCQVHIGFYAHGCWRGAPSKLDRVGDQRARIHGFAPLIDSPAVSQQVLYEIDAAVRRFFNVREGAPQFRLLLPSRPP